MTDSKKRDIEKDNVFLGLQKRKKCALCLQTFDVDELPGAISHNSIRELRVCNTHTHSCAPYTAPCATITMPQRKWGVGVGKKPSPSKLYQREELCVFCMQFFDV
eukprot:Rhum_TRINITY_DN3591_c0_g2::Rhum_TRINITY_DN3591_c0_g2_i1::g.11360::m.11360